MGRYEEIIKKIHEILVESGKALTLNELYNAMPELTEANIRAILNKACKDNEYVSRVGKGVYAPIKYGEE